MDTIVFFVVVFFKQKTAYDMRISDWSSDVCSSDLTLFCVVGTDPHEPEQFPPCAASGNRRCGRGTSLVDDRRQSHFETACACIEPHTVALAQTRQWSSAHCSRGDMDRSRNLATRPTHASICDECDLAALVLHHAHPT